MGVLWRSFFIIDVYTVVALSVLTVMLVGVGVLLEFHWSMLYGVLFFLTAFLGVFRTEYAFVKFDEGRVFSEGVHFQGEGFVCREPDERDGYTLLVLENSHSKGETRFRVRVPQYPVLSYGERVVVEGEVHVPESFTTETGRMFDYEGYLMKEGVHYELKNASLENKEEFVGGAITARLLGLKHSWLGALSRRVPEPSASLAGGVIVGAKRSLGEKWLDAFRDTGIIHIVVLSGYNLTLIANFMVRATTMLPRAFGFGFGVLGVVSFAAMVGGGATVVRASIMALIGMVATFIYRPYMLVRALVLAGVSMVLWNPFILVFDSGFQLSFMATLGLILLVPHLERFFLWVPELWMMRDIVLATLATQLAVLPLLLFQMGRVSVVSPLVNVLILPLVPFVMLTGFVAGVLEMAHIFLSVPFAWVTHLILSYMFFVVELFSAMPFVAVDVPPIPWWLLVLMYIFPTLFFLYKNKTARPV